MRSSNLLRVLPLIALGCAATQSATPSGQAAPTQATPAGAAQQEATTLATGLVIPADYDEVSLWPKAYAGELFVLEVVPHGTTVEENQVIARLDVRPYQEQLEAAQLDLRSADVEHANLAERGLMSEEKAAEPEAPASAGRTQNRPTTHNTRIVDAAANDRRPMPMLFQVGRMKKSL